MFNFVLTHPPTDAKPDVIRGLVYTDNKRPDEKYIKDSTPIEIRQLMKKCWKKDPNDRPASGGGYIVLLFRYVFFSFK